MSENIVLHKKRITIPNKNLVIADPLESQRTLQTVLKKGQGHDFRTDLKWYGWIDPN